MRFLDLKGIKNIPKDRVVTYARIVVDYRPQKADPNRVRITAGGNLIQYPGELTTRTTDLRTTKKRKHQWTTCKICCLDIYLNKVPITLKLLLPMAF